MVKARISEFAGVFEGTLDLRTDRLAVCGARERDDCARKLLAAITEKRAEMNAEFDKAAAEVVAKMQEGGR